MTKQDEIWIAESIESGKKYGFPKCCIDEFIASPPSTMNGAPSKAILLRYSMAKIKGEFTGFIPCLKHAQMIKDRKITLSSLIDVAKREEILPFPHGWSFK